jgi:hypothetical protein
MSSLALHELLPNFHVMSPVVVDDESLRMRRAPRPLNAWEQLFFEQSDQVRATPVFG